MPYSESFVTVKESPGMSTEANFVFGNKIFLQTAAKMIFCINFPIFMFENAIAKRSQWEQPTFRLPHVRCVFRLPQVEHCIVLYLQHCIAFPAFVLHLQHLHCIAFPAWLLVGTVFRFLDQSNQNVFEKTTGLES